MGNYDGLIGYYVKEYEGVFNKIVGWHIDRGEVHLTMINSDGRLYSTPMDSVVIRRGGTNA